MGQNNTAGEFWRFYSEPGAMSTPGAHARLYDGLPDDVGELVRIVQGLVTYDVVFSEIYGFRLPTDRLAEIHLRSAEQMLGRIETLCDDPLTVPRPPAKRVLGRCRHYTLLLVSMLRAKGVPSRARVGFGRYFGRDGFEDHWVCEYWNRQLEKWTLVDAQMDEKWRARLGLRIDPTDVPRDQFLVSSDGWNLCRAHRADPSAFGISFAGLHGLWFVANNLLRDLAALNKMEMLPWDAWGGHLQPNQELKGSDLALFDRVAELTHDPDSSFEELRRTYEEDPRCRVPPMVFNGILGRPDRI